jgi:hypothetical protein
VREAAEVLRVEKVVGTSSCWTLTRCFVPRIGRYELRHPPSRPVRQPITCAEMVQTKVGGDSAGPDYSAAGLRACSACAGEYEDPDATSWTEVPDEGHEQELELEEFPVRRD